MENPTLLLFRTIGDCEFKSDLVEQVRLLLQSGADPKAQDYDGQTPLLRLLHLWGLYGESRVDPDRLLETARLLIVQGTDVSKADISGRTALTYVVENRFSHWRTLLQELQEAGAVAGVMDASWLGDARILEKLLKQGANADASVKVDCHIFPTHSRYAIQIAAWWGHAECVRLLLEYGANPNFWNNLGPMPPTAIACAVRSNRPDILDMLLRSDALMKPSHGRDLLVDAVERDYPEVVRLLLSYGVDVNAHGIGSTVRRAAELGHADVMRLLLEDPHNISKSRWKLHEALWNAADAGHSEVVRLLLEQRVETHRRIQGKTPLKIAEERGHTNVMELLSAPPQVPYK